MRALAVLVAAAVVGAAGAGAGAAPAHGARHAAAGAKRKHCGARRHGRAPCERRRRTHRDAAVTVGDDAARAAAGAGAGGPATVGPSAVGTQAEPGSTPPPRPLGHLQVVAHEFTLALSRQSVASGSVSVELDNLGQDPHDLRVERTDAPGTGFDFALTQPSTVTTRRLDLGPGTWKLYCTLPGHDEAGMHALVTVSP